MEITDSARNRMFSNKDLVRLIIPLIIEQMLTVTVGLADSIMTELNRAYTRNLNRIYSDGIEIGKSLFGIFIILYVIA